MWSRNSGIIFYRNLHLPGVRIVRDDEAPGRANQLVQLLYGDDAEDVLASGPWLPNAPVQRAQAQVAAPLSREDFASEQG